MSRLEQLTGTGAAALFAPVALAFAIVQSGCICGTVDQGVQREEQEIELDRPSSIATVDFVESDNGDPKLLGCSDGQREGFANAMRHPLVAGCVGTWDGAKSLRDKPTGKACGDDAGPCAVPADVCAEGWHVCATNGKNTDITDRTSWVACDEAAGPGKFVAAMSHGQTQELCPPPPKADTVFPCMAKGICAEPVCCGDDCAFGKCRDAIWPGGTRISRGKAEGCGAVRSGNNGGILCCKDDDAEAPEGAVPAEEPIELGPKAGPLRK